MDLKRRVICAVVGHRESEGFELKHEDSVRTLRGSICPRCGVFSPGGFDD